MPLELTNCSAVAPHSRSRPRRLSDRSHWWAVWSNSTGKLALLPPLWMQARALVQTATRHTPPLLPLPPPSTRRS
eukprot:135960-Prymnesium_polylepis.1